MSNRAARGLTLIELMVVVGLLALVSVMAAQALSMGLVQARGLGRSEARQSELALALSLLRQDLEAAVALPLRPRLGTPEPAFRPGIGSAALSRGGMPELALPEAPGFARIEWRHDPAGARLLRRIRPLEGAQDPGPEVEILSGVTGFRLEPLGLWAAAPDGLPPGFVMQIETRSFGSLRLVVAR